MSNIVKAIVGEANYHSPEEQAQLKQAVGASGAPPAEDHERSGAPEERREAQIAQRIIDLCDNGRHQLIHRQSRTPESDAAEVLFQIKREAIQLLQMH